MPRPTWWNLPPDKRERITTVAMAEFGARGFSAGSLNAIARGAGIAKGSLFQYFRDKLDLFETVSEVAAERIEAEALRGTDPDDPLFPTMRGIVLRWMAFYRTHPGERGIAFATQSEVDREVRRRVRGVANAHFGKALWPMVDAARVRGELRSEVDPALVVSALTMVLRHLNLAPFEPEGDPSIPFPDLSDDEADRVAVAYVDALEAAFT